MRELRFWYGWLLRGALIATAAACDPTIGSGIAVAPTPAVGPATLERNVRHTAENVARRNGMEPEDDPDHVEDNGWVQCFHRGGLRLCAKTVGASTQLLLTQFPTFHFTPWADSVRRELLDSLRARFGPDGVRECEWNTRTNACADAHPTRSTRTGDSTSRHNHATTGATSFILEGNRVYALLTFLNPNGSTHAAYAYVDMGAADMALSAPLYDSLVNTGAPGSFVKISQIRTLTTDRIGPMLRFSAA